jgi:hypothetical protein
MYLGVLNPGGAVLLRRHLTASPAPLLTAIAPDREELVGCVEGIFTWDWLADLCACEDLPFVLGYALSLKAIHGGKAQNEPIDEAPVLAARNNPAGPKDLARLERQHGTGNALTSLAHMVARAVDDMQNRATAFNLDTCLREYGSGVGEPAPPYARGGCPREFAISH